MGSTTKVTSTCCWIVWKLITVMKKDFETYFPLAGLLLISIVKLMLSDSKKWAGVDRETLQSSKLSSSVKIWAENFILTITILFLQVSKFFFFVGFKVFNLSEVCSSNWQIGFTLTFLQRRKLIEKRKNLVNL